MKKLLLIGLLAICTIAARSQGRATTDKEYKYLLAGKYEANMPGHHLVKSQAYATDHTQAATIWALYRDGASSSCALVIMYYENNVPKTYLCVPDVKSPESMWADYNKRLSALKNNGNALQVIAMALGRFAAAE